MVFHCLHDGEYNAIQVLRHIVVPKANATVGATRQGLTLVLSRKTLLLDATPNGMEEYPTGMISPLPVERLRQQPLKRREPPAHEVPRDTVLVE